LSKPLIIKKVATNSIKEATNARECAFLGRETNRNNAARRGQKIKNPVIILIHKTVSSKKQYNADHHDENIKPNISVLK
jgi:hypothetical protein